MRGSFHYLHNELRMKDVQTISDYKMSTKNIIHRAKISLFSQRELNIGHDRQDIFQIDLSDKKQNH